MHPKTTVLHCLSPERRHLSKRSPAPSKMIQPESYALRATTRIHPIRKRIFATDYLLRQCGTCDFQYLGQQVVTLVDREQPAGFYEIRWDGRNSFRAGNRQRRLYLSPESERFCGSVQNDQIEIARIAIDIAELQRALQRFLYRRSGGNNAFFCRTQQPAHFTAADFGFAVGFTKSGEATVFLKLKHREQTCPVWSSSFLATQPTTYIFIFDNHNHAFCFWITAFAPVFPADYDWFMSISTAICANRPFIRSHLMK